MCVQWASATAAVINVSKPVTEEYSENDVQELTTALQETDADSLNWQTIETGLTHPNLKVREIAEKLLKHKEQNTRS